MRTQIDTIDTHVGPRRALVVAPAEPVVVGAERLTELRDDPRPSAIDQRVLAAASEAGDATLLVFRGTSDAGEPLYRIDEALSDDDANELVYGLVRTQQRSYRRLAAAGLTLLIHTGFDLTDCSRFRDQTDRVRTELGRGDATAQLDAWILEHMTKFYTAGYRRLSQDTLPGILPLMERRRPHLEEQLAAVPPEELS